jgi:hypothetical protein
VVNNVRKPLELGYVMLRNRSQKDIKEGVGTVKAREMEAAFFALHPAFKELDPRLYGVGQLSRKLTALLVRRIKAGLAPMKAAVDAQLADVRTQLRAIPTLTYAAAASAADRQKLLVTIVQQYVRHLTESIRGEYRERVMVRHAGAFG